MGVFSKDSQKDTKVKRNAFDGSFQNNLTMKMGYIYPCLCKEVIPGDSFRINSAFGLRFMPTAFPVQTKIRCDLHLFYVRLRNLWNYWENYYTGVGKHDSFPVLSRSEVREQTKTGSLGDYLGLPSTIVGDNVSYSGVPVIPQYNSGVSSETSFNFGLSTSINGVSENIVNTAQDTRFFYFENLTESGSAPSGVLNQPIVSFKGVNYHKFSLVGDTSFYKNFIPTTPGVDPQLGYNVYFGYVKVGILPGSDNLIPVTSSLPAYQCCVLDGNDLLIREDVIVNADNGSKLLLFFFDKEPFRNLPYDAFISVRKPSVDGDIQLKSFNNVAQIVSFQDTNYTVQEATSVIADDIPYDISALPFRAYEQIYNSFYRDDRNNPFLVNGEYDPNIFIPNSNGGVDSTQYRLHKRNWEQDFLTTALPSPQFGQAPLVGLTPSGVASFALDDGTIVSSQLETDESGDKVVAFSTTKDANVNRQLVNMATSGISINDLRGVNSLQRYLETKYRIGLRYRDQVKAHFGVEISREELDMPEFIGSFTQMVDVTQINQTTPTYLSSGDIKDALGSYAGQLSCVGGRDRGFQKYFDEPGYVIGLISVVPVPAYSQLLPKHFTKINEPLDFYSPEFGHLGFQPIRYREVCPLQAYINGVSLDQTFGYQRAWYDYLSSQDEIHGQFRTSLNDFVLARAFNTVPSLNEDFLTVDPDSMNDIFTVNEVNNKPVDTILGQIHFDITMMRPIPRFGIPRLE